MHNNKLLNKWFQKPSTLTNLGNSKIANTINDKSSPTTTITTATTNSNTTQRKLNGTTQSNDGTLPNINPNHTPTVTNTKLQPNTTTAQTQREHQLDTNNNDSTIANTNDEEMNIINRYADDFDNISHDFINKLPANDKAALTKLLEQQQQILPQEKPFILVQPKNKGKSTTFNSTLKITNDKSTEINKQMTTPPQSPPDTKKLSPN
jgi:hypothetical protein